MNKDRFRFCLIPCALAFCLTACGMSGGNKGYGESQDTTGTTEQTTELTAEQTTEQTTEQTAAEDSEPEIAEGYQFVSGLGIFDPGSPVVYQMTNLNVPELKNEYGTAQLLNAFYQDGKALVTVLYKDYSAYLLSEDEVLMIQRAEKENLEKQERGETVSRDSSYFCIDDEKQIYGRSAFMEKIQGMETSEGKEPFGGRMYIPGSPEPEYGFSRSSIQASFGSFLDTGYVPRLVQFIKDEKYPLTDGPDGIHELKLNYFEEPFVFEFRKADELASLQELEGLTEREGISFYAEGEQKDGKLLLSSYYYSDDQYRISPLSPTDMTVYAEFQDGDRMELEGMTLLSENQVKTRDTFTGITNGSLQKRAYAIPDKQGMEKVTVSYKALYMMDPSTITTCTFPIPGDEEKLDISAEFSDGILNIKKVSRVEEKMKRGTDGEGNDILKPQIYLTGAVEDKRSDRHIHLILATDVESEKNGGGSPFDTETYYSEVDTGQHAARQDGTIQGFYVGYEEGARSVTIRFHGASFVWNTKIDVPVSLR